MNRMLWTLCVFSALCFGAVACTTTERANDKLEECIEEEYGEEQIDEMMLDWEITCDDGEEDCDECVECVLDNECSDVLDGECLEICP